MTLVFPASATEYEQVRAEVETSPRPPVETKPAGRPEAVARLAEHIRRWPPVETNPADRAEGKEGAATAYTPGGGCYAVTATRGAGRGACRTWRTRLPPRHRTVGCGHGRET